MTETLTQRMKRVSEIAADCGFVVGVLQGLEWNGATTEAQEAAIEAAISAMERIEAATWRRECEQVAHGGTLQPMRHEIDDEWQTQDTGAESQAHGTESQKGRDDEQA